MRALRAVFVVHAVCIGLLPLAMAEGWPMLLLVAAFALSWWRLRRHPVLGFGPQAIRRLVFHGDGSWTLERESGRPLEADLQPGSIVHPALLVLRFRLKAGGTATRLILSQDADPEALRRLRARLSLG